MADPDRVLGAAARPAKVPEVTPLFWVLTILSTTVGDTAADLLSGDVGLTTSSLAVAAVLAAVLVVQLLSRCYVPSIYWAAVVLLAVVGTLVSDDLVDRGGLGLWTTTALFAACLGATLAVWFGLERTLAMPSVVTRRREVFHWLAVLWVFALGTSAGDLFLEQVRLGHGTAAVEFGVVITLVALAYYAGVDVVLTFWIGYVLTRPFGASVGDLLTAGRDVGGYGLGTGRVTGLLLAVILAVVAWFTLRDRQQPVGPPRAPARPR